MIFINIYGGWNRKKECLKKFVEILNVIFFFIWMLLGLVYNVGKIYYKYLVERKNNMCFVIGIFFFNGEIKIGVNNCGR